jgi:hypothetical protein
MAAVGAAVGVEAAVEAVATIEVRRFDDGC